jgi:hypothetical protein
MHSDEQHAMPSYKLRSPLMLIVEFSKMYYTTVTWCSETALSQKLLTIGHMFIYTFLLRMTDTMTSKSTDLSPGTPCIWKDVCPHIKHFGYLSLATQKKKSKKDWQEYLKDINLWNINLYHPDIGCWWLHFNFGGNSICVEQWDAGLAEPAHALTQYNYNDAQKIKLSRHVRSEVAMDRTCRKEEWYLFEASEKKDHRG